MTRAAIYCRISDDRMGDQAGVARQEQDCRDLAQRRGWTVTDVYVDNSKSAWKRNRRRPGWDALLEAVKNRSIDAIVVYHGDRLIRQPYDLEQLLLLTEGSGIQLASPSGTRDLANPDDLFIVRIEAAHACRSSDDSSRRLRRKHLELAQAGEPVGGTRPFGYQPDRRTLNPAEADLIQEAARRVLAGESLYAIVVDFNQRGVVMPRGGRWTQTALRRILTAPRTGGFRSLDGAITARGQWEPLLDEVTWRRVAAVLADPARRKVDRFPARRYLLSGYLYCGRPGCGTRLVASPRQTRARSYVCPVGPKGGCGLRIVAEPLDEHIKGLVEARLDTLDLAARYADAHNRPDDSQHLVDELAAAQFQLEDAARQLADGMTLPEWNAYRGRVLERIAGLEAQLAQTAVNEALDPAMLAAGWPDDLHLQRAILTLVLERITIQAAAQPRGWFDPDRVDVAWRV